MVEPCGARVHLSASMVSAPETPRYDTFIYDRHTWQVAHQVAVANGLRSAAQHRRRGRPIVPTVHNVTTARDLQPHQAGARRRTSHGQLARNNLSVLQVSPPRQSWGRGPSPLGVAANTGPSVDVSFTASCAAPTGRVPGLRGAFIIFASTPCSCVGVLGTNIAVLLDCSKSPSFLTSLLTYCTEGVITHGRYEATNPKQVADMEGNTGPHRWVVLFGKEQCDVKGSGTR